MAGLPQITDAESLVMEVLWAGAPRTADHVRPPSSVRHKTTEQL